MYLDTIFQKNCISTDCTIRERDAIIDSRYSNGPPAEHLDTDLPDKIFSVGQKFREREEEIYLTTRGHSQISTPGASKGLENLEERGVDGLGP